MSLTDAQITINQQIQLHKQMIRDHQMSIRALQSLLPEKRRGRRPVYVLNPKTGQREEVRP